MIRRYAPLAVFVLLAVGALALGVGLGRAWGDPPGGEPVVSRSFYAERNGPKATGRICSQVIASGPAGVGVALSCSYPPAESRIADLLEGAGQ